MSGCDNSNIRKNYIVSGVEIDILSACTGFYTDNIYNCSGDTLTLHSDNVSANTINSSVYLSGGTNLLDIFDSFDNFTTASTLIGNVAYFDRTNALSAYTLDLSTLVDNNTFVTGFTYDNSNNLSIIRNDNISIGVNISQFSGLTINGGLSATTLSACTGIYTSNLYGCSPINVNDNLVILSGITLSSITNNNLLTQILVRDSINGAVEYRDVGTIISASSANTFVTAFTYDNINTFTISDNSGNTFNSTIDILSATTISATTYYGDGSNLSGISTDNFYVSGGTYDTVSKNVNFSGNSIETTFSVDLTSLVSSVSGDTFVNGGNANVTTSELTFSNNTGGTFTVTNSAALFSDNDINVTGGTYNPSNGCVTFVTNSGTTFDVCGFVTGITDTFVTGGTYNDSTDIITFTNTSGNTFNVTGITDSYTTGSTINGTTIQFDNNLLGLNYYNVDLLPLLSGKTNNTTFNTYTSDTQTIINTKISGATNLSTTGIFGQKNGQNLEFKGITSTGGTVTITNDSNSVNLDVIIPPDTNTFVTGFTYDNSNNLTISRNDGSGFTTNISTMSGLTVNGTLDGGTILSGGTNLTTIIESFDTYVTGGTVSITATPNTNSATIGLLYKNSEGVPHTLPFNDTFTTGATYDNGTALVTFDKNDGTSYLLNLSAIDVSDTFVTGGTYSSGTTSLDFSGNTGFVPFSVNVSELIDDTNTFVTGFTYNDVNTFTINDNAGSAFTASINVLSATTISATTFYGDGSNLTGLVTTDNYVSGGTYNTGTTAIDFVGTNTATTFSVNVSDLIDDTNTFVTGGTFTSGGTLELEKNNGINVLPIDFTSTKRLVINSDQSLAISAGRAYLSNTGVSLLSFDNSPPSVDDEASFNFNVPSDYVSGGTFYLQITSLGSTPPNNEIQFEMDITSINVGGDLSTTTDSALQNVTSASTTNWELVESPPYTPSSATFTQNKNVSVKINRDVSDVADTYNDTAYVWGLVFEYVGIR